MAREPSRRAPVQRQALAAVQPLASALRREKAEDVMRASPGSTVRSIQQRTQVHLFVACWMPLSQERGVMNETTLWKLEFLMSSLRLTIRRKFG
jgi:hypothetical protein